MLGKYFFVGPETVTLSFTTEILFLNVKMRTVLLHLKQDLKLFYSGNVSIDSHA